MKTDFALAHPDARTPKQKSPGKRMQSLWFVGIWLIAAAAMLAQAAANADERVVISARGSVTSDDIKGVDFDRYEVGLMYPLPWRWQWPAWSLSTHVIGSAGALDGGSETAFIGSVGLSVMVSWENVPLSVDVGTSPTYVSEDIYDEADIGGKYHFTSHIAIRGWIAERFGIGYRFQHTSNASSQSPNPGVDSHMLELSYRF